MRDQQVLGRLHLLFSQLLKGKPCQVLLSPLDVRLPDLNEKNEIVDTVVQPDLLVVCDQAKRTSGASPARRIW